MSDPAADRARLTGYIAASRRVQRRLALGLGVGVVIALGATAWSTTIAAIAALTLGIVAICGFWVTAAHISDWKMRLRHLDRTVKVEPTKSQVRRGSGRR